MFFSSCVAVFRPSRFLAGILGLGATLTAVLAHYDWFAVPLEAAIVAVLLSFAVVTFRAFWDHLHEDVDGDADAAGGVVEFMSFSHLAVSITLTAVSVCLLATHGGADFHWAQASTLVCLLSMLYMACACGHVCDAIVHHNYRRDNAGVELVLVYDTWFPMAMNVGLVARLAGVECRWIQTLVWEPLSVVDALAEWPPSSSLHHFQPRDLAEELRAWQQHSAEALLQLVGRALRTGDVHILLHLAAILGGALITLVYGGRILPVLIRRQWKRLRAHRTANGHKAASGAVPANRTPATASSTAKKSKPRVPTPMTLRRKNLRSQGARKDPS